MYEWCQDNGFTPYLATIVDKRTHVPSQYISEGQIMLNIASSATKNLLLENEWITFQATFGGVIQDIVIPISNVIAIFAKENSQGMQFEVEVITETAPAETTKKPSGLQLIK